MTSQARLIALVLSGGAIAIMLGVWFITPNDGAAGNGWRPAERAEFVRNCVEECRKAAGVTPEHYPVCDNACGCAIDEGEKIMTAREADAASQATKSNTASAQQKAAMEQMKKAGLRCAANTLRAKAPTQK